VIPGFFKRSPEHALSWLGSHLLKPLQWVRKFSPGSETETYQHYSQNLPNYEYIIIMIGKIFHVPSSNKFIYKSHSMRQHVVFYRFRNVTEFFGNSYKETRGKLTSILIIKVLFPLD
jgi:hypothetical protein